MYEFNKAERCALDFTAEIKFWGNTGLVKKSSAPQLLRMDNCLIRSF